jgi:Tfp pilus assembly protein PilF
MSVLLEALARSRKAQQANDAVADASGAVDPAPAGLSLAKEDGLSLAPEVQAPPLDLQPHGPETQRETDPGQASVTVRALKEAALASGSAPSKTQHAWATPGSTRPDPRPASSDRRRRAIVVGSATTTLLLAGLLGGYLWTLSNIGSAVGMPARANPWVAPAAQGQPAAPAGQQAVLAQTAPAHPPAAAAPKLASSTTGQPAAAAPVPAKEARRAPAATTVGETSPAVRSRAASLVSTASVVTSPTVAAPVVLTSGPRNTVDRLRVAYSSLTEGDLAGARLAYEAILKDSPRELDALLGLAFIERTQGRPGAARALYQRALELQPGQMDAQLGFLSSTADLGLDDPAVLALARDVAQSRPESAAAQFAAGQLLALKGDLSSATALLERAATLQPANALYLFNWAVALDRLGRRSQALQVYRQVLQGAGTDDATDLTGQGVNRDTVRRRIEALQAALPSTDPARP